jgi:hypothetical protein
LQKAIVPDSTPPLEGDLADVAPGGPARGEGDGVGFGRAHANIDLLFLDTNHFANIHESCDVTRCARVSGDKTIFLAPSGRKDLIPSRRSIALPTLGECTNA